MAEQRVVVERHLGVEHAQLALLGDDQRIDLQHRHVLGDEGRVELRHQLLRLLGEIAGEIQRLRDGAAVMAHDAGGRIDREGDDLFGRVVRDVLDVDAAFGRDHERHFRGFAVDQDREIELLVDVGAFLDVEAVDLLAVRAGLHRDQRRAQHLLGEFVDLGDRLGDADAALVAGGGFLELALAAAAGMDLALHHPDRAGKRLGGGIGIRGLQAPARRAKSARRIHAAAPWPGIHGYSSGRSPNPCAANSTVHRRSCVLAYHIPTELQLRIRLPAR